jgi:hypothetical protein
MNIILSNNSPLSSFRLLRMTVGSARLAVMSLRIEFSVLQLILDFCPTCLKQMPEMHALVLHTRVTSNKHFVHV